jgi:predicted transcriptional regulator YdeE
MEPTMAQREAFTVLGLQERFTPENEDHQGIWQRFTRFHDQIQPHSTDGAYYGVNFGADESQAIDYLAGMAVVDV